MPVDVAPLYFRVSPAIWRQRSWTEDMRLLAFYLLTNQHRTLEGLFTLPKPYIFGDMKWSAERLGEPFAQLLADGFFQYEETEEVCLIMKALHYQGHANDNMRKAGLKRVQTVPPTDLDRAFFEAARLYAEPFAELLRERLPERFGEHVSKHSAQLNSALTTSTPSTEVGGTDKAAVAAGHARTPVETPREGSKGGEKEQAGGADSRPATSKRFAPATCDGGEPCACLRIKGIRPIISRIDPLHSGQIWARGTPIGGAMAKLAAYLCVQAQQILPTLEREQREEACQRMLIRVAERIAAAHASEHGPINNLPRYIGGMLAKQSLGEVVGDDLVEELRREASASYGNGKREGEPQPLGAVLAKRKSAPAQL